MQKGFILKFLYIIFSFFIFNLFENFKFSFIPFITSLIILILFLEIKDNFFKFSSLILSLLLLFFSYFAFFKYIYIPVFLIIFIWLNNFIKNPKVLFIIHLILGFFLFFSISALKEINLMNFLISLHFSLPFSLSFIKETLYLKEEPKFPYGHLLPVLFGFTGVIFIILRIYSILLFIPFFILLSISIYSTLYQPPYDKPYPLIYQICIFSSMILNYFGTKL